MNLPDFAAWLETLPPGEIIGRAGLCRFCPLSGQQPARYRRHSWVRGTHWRLLKGSWEELPSWARLFVQAVDAKGLGVPIRASEALGIVRKIERVRI